MHNDWHQFVPAGSGFFGASLMMTFLGSMPRRMWIVALLSGAAFAKFLTPSLLAYLLHSGATWLASDGIEAAIGFLIGTLSIFFFGALATFGKRFAEDPTSLGGLRK